jgi:hypothetical protein
MDQMLLISVQYKESHAQPPSFRARLISALNLSYLDNQQCNAASMSHFLIGRFRYVVFRIEIECN